MLATGLIVAYAYILETFSAWYGGNTYEQAMGWHRITGPHAGSYWSLMRCNNLRLQELWFKKVRRQPVFLFISAIVVLVGMWLERYVIIVSSLAQDFLPRPGSSFRPTDP